MTYELAKQLKEAGFPQKDIDCEDRWVCCIHSNYFTSDGDRNDTPYQPTLSELIEACEESIHGILMIDKFGAGVKRAKCTTPDIDWIQGSSNEEAVAKLWLALHT